MRFEIGRSELHGRPDKELAAERVILTHRPSERPKSADELHATQ
jgi:hypothetical protein